jgi:hypothetical protein
MKYIILYVEGGSTKTKKFRSKKAALVWAEPIIKADGDGLWISGLVVGEYIDGKLDGKDEAITERLK